LNKYAERPEAQDELNYWSRVLDGPTTELPCDSAADSMNLENRAETVTVRLSRAETRALLQQVPAAQHAEINDILLAALADCLKTWTRADSLLVDLEGHGRTEIAENIDVSVPSVGLRLFIRCDSICVGARHWPRGQNYQRPPSLLFPIRV
jgi:DNA-directed RNA polymerase specialized sigma24 family protein